MFSIVFFFFFVSLLNFCYNTHEFISSDTDSSTLRSHVTSDNFGEDGVAQLEREEEDREEDEADEQDEEQNSGSDDQDWAATQKTFGVARPRDFDWRQVDSDCMDGTFNNLHTFVQFVGYPRSGHTLVAMLLDAHPNIVISNEYNILEKWEKFSSIEDIYMKILEKSIKRYSPIPRKDKKHAKNEVGHYNYRVPGAWQGRWQCLRVIGDKKGSSTTNGLRRDWDETVGKLDWIKEQSGLKMRYFHVIRNPFDNIATMITRSIGVRTHGANATTTQVAPQWNNRWMSKVERWLRSFELNMAFAKSVPSDAILHVHGHALLRDAIAETRRWCAFLQIECPRRYSEAVARVLFSSPWQARKRVTWSPAVIHRIEHFIAQHDELKGYSFDSDI